MILKQVKLLIALLAVVFSVASALTAHAKFATATYSHINGSLTTPSSYRFSPYDYNGSIHFSGVQVTKDQSNLDIPEDLALDDLYSASSHFAAPGTYRQYGKVISVCKNI